MWAKNGAKYLPVVLKRIDEVIPVESISQKIFVDDKSTDSSREIAREFNWTVYPNPTGWISGGTNEALRHVREDFFVSIEQDVILAKNWWDKIPLYMKDESVAIAQGWRMSTHPVIRMLEREHIERMFGEMKPKRIADYTTIDNNIYRTKVIRGIGGFPKIEPITVDYFLKREIESKTDFKWIADTSVVSEHIMTSITNHYKRHGRHHLPYTVKSLPIDKLTLPQILGILAISPVRGLQIALRRKYPQIFAVYPYVQLIYFESWAIRRKSTQVVEHRTM